MMMMRKPRCKRLPNNFGSIRFLGAGRRNAYAVHVPGRRGRIAEGVEEESGGQAGCGVENKRRKAICYTATWEEGYQVLVLFHAGVITADEPADAIWERLKQINNYTVESHTGENDPRDKMIQYAKKMLVDLELIRGGTEKRYHTPHSTRHTFSRLCESYDVKEADRKRMMGHSLKGDVTNGVYGHRSVAELSREIEKIKACVNVRMAG